MYFYKISTRDEGICEKPEKAKPKKIVIHKKKMRFIALTFIASAFAMPVNSNDLAARKWPTDAAEGIKHFFEHPTGTTKEVYHKACKTNPEGCKTLDNAWHKIETGAEKTWKKVEDGSKKTWKKIKNAF